MNVLFISPECPYPPEKNGGTHTVFNLVMANTQHTIDLIYYRTKDEDAERALLEQGAFDSISFVPFRRRTGKVAHLKSLLKKVPYAQYQYDPGDFAISDSYDAIVYDQFSSEMLLSRGIKARQICFVADSAPLYFERKAQLATGALESVYYQRQSAFAKRCEKETLKVADKLVFVSQEDAAFSARLYGEEKKCSAINLGIDSIDGIAPMDLGRSIVFTGIMDYAPNEDAALFFLSDVFPEIAKRFPDVTLYLVGKNPTDKLNRACSGFNNVVLTGYVDSVVSYMLGATVYVSPLRYGTGVKNKVLEAMKCGAPSVFSNVSIEAIPEVKPGVNCLVANTADEWVNAVESLLSDSNERNRLSANLTSVFGGDRDWAASLEALLS